MTENAERGLLARVRSTCRETAAAAGQVGISGQRLASYARSLPLERLVAPTHDPETHFLTGNAEETAGFFLTLDSINFGSGWFPHLNKAPGRSGYFTIAAGLADHYRKRSPLTAGDLAEITAGACAQIFGQDPANVEAMELMVHFAKALNDLGHSLLNRFAGRFMNLLAASERSVEKLAAILIEMPLFRDQARYRGREVYFYKRAQIAAADLALAFRRQAPGDFIDLDRLTLFADNLVPHVLRLDGILTYTPELAATIDGGIPVPHGGEAEIEIRACALTAVERLVQALNESGRRVSAMELDWLLWNRGQQPHYKQSKPRHRTRCTFY